jgi:hypothetical protein
MQIKCTQEKFASSQLKNKKSSQQVSNLENEGSIISSDFSKSSFEKDRQSTIKNTKIHGFRKKVPNKFPT